MKVEVVVGLVAMGGYGFWEFFLNQFFYGVKFQFCPTNSGHWSTSYLSGSYIKAMGPLTPFTFYFTYK